MLKTNYDKSADVLCLHLSDAPVARVSYGWQVNVGYAADGQAAEITILDVESLLGEGPSWMSSVSLSPKESRSGFWIGSIIPGGQTNTS